MSPPKLPRATLEQKIQILDFYHQSNRPQLETVDRYKNEISISTSSFSEWLKNEDELRERLLQAGSSFSKNSRRKVKFKYEKINRAMDLLVKQRLERHEPINEPILREYWSIYAHQYGVEDPKRLVGFSHGWLSQFKKRHGLNKKKMNGSGTMGADGIQTSPGGSSMAVSGVREGGDVYETNFSNDETSAGNTSENTHTSETSALNQTGFTATPSANSPTYDIMHTDPTPNSTAASNGPQFNTQSMAFPSNGTNYAFPSYSMYQHLPHDTYEITPQAARKEPQTTTLIPYNYELHLRAQYENQKRQLELHEKTGKQSQSQSVEESRVQLPHKQDQEQHQNLQQKQQQQQQDPAQPEQNQGHSDQGRRKSQRSKVGLQHSRKNRNPSNTSATSIASTNMLQDRMSQVPVGDQDTGSQISASDIERFIYMFADKFFNDNRHTYPQTVKIFQDFKNSFFNERIMNLRSIQQQQLLQQAAAQHQANVLILKHSQLSGIDDFFLRNSNVTPSGQNMNGAVNGQRLSGSLENTIPRLHDGGVLSTNSNAVVPDVTMSSKRWDSRKTD